MADLMWAMPDGCRRLVVSSERAATFVTAVYRFDEVLVSAVSVSIGRRSFRLEVPALRLSWTARAGRGLPLPLLRPAWVTRHVAGPIAWRLLGVRTYGVSPTGVREWYRASWYRPLVGARAAVGGHDLGRLQPLDPPVRFGFSEPPRRPSMVAVRPLLHDPTGAVARAVGGR